MKQARQSDGGNGRGWRGPDLILRPARTSDTKAVIAADIAASALFAPTGLLSPDALADHVEAAEIRQSIREGMIEVAIWQNHGVVGFIQYNRLGDDIYLSQLSVDPAFGRRGIGRALLSFLDRRSAMLGARRIVLSTFRDLAWNGPFYASAGFVELPRAALKTYMHDIERAQAAFMDVSKRIFMAKTVRHS